TRAPKRIRKSFIPATAALSTAEFPGLGESFRPRLLGNPNRLRVCKFADTCGAKLASKTRALHATERQTRIGCHHGVNENHSGLQLGCEKFFLLSVFGPCARTQAETGVVREFDGGMDIAYTKNRRDRAEDFFAVRR